jgi:hypothetical protein
VQAAGPRSYRRHIGHRRHRQLRQPHLLPYPLRLGHAVICICRARHHASPGERRCRPTGERRREARKRGRK